MCAANSGAGTSQWLRGAEIAGQVEMEQQIAPFLTGKKKKCEGRWEI